MNRIKTPLLIFLAFIGGTLVSLATTLVLANGGDPTQIHSCVKNSTLLPNSANVRIVGLNVNCASGETSVNWPATASASMNGNSFKVYDANNNFLGIFTGGTPGGPSGISIYNSSLDKYITINNVQPNGFTPGAGTVQDQVGSLDYHTNNCTGTAYVENDLTNDFLIPLGNNTYGVVDTNNAPTTVQILSHGQYDYDSDSIIDCTPVSANTLVRDITITALPFSFPVATPLKIKYQ